MKNLLESGVVTPLDKKELFEIEGGLIDPFTIGLVIGGLIALWRFVIND